MNFLALICIIVSVVSFGHSTKIDRLNAWNIDSRVQTFKIEQIAREVLIECLNTGEQAKALRPKINTSLKNLINSKILNMYFIRQSLSKCVPFLEKLKQDEEAKKMEQLKKIQEEKENQIYRKFLANRIKSTILKDFITMRY